MCAGFLKGDILGRRGNDWLIFFFFLGGDLLVALLAFIHCFVDISNFERNVSSQSDLIYIMFRDIIRLEVSRAAPSFAHEFLIISRAV